MPEKNTVEVAEKITPEEIASKDWFNETENLNSDNPVIWEEDVDKKEDVSKNTGSKTESPTDPEGVKGFDGASIFNNLINTFKIDIAEGVTEESVIEKIQSQAFANEAVSKLNSFIKEGGNIESYFSRLNIYDQVLMKSDKEIVFENAVHGKGLTKEVADVIVEKAIADKTLEKEALEIRTRLTAAKENALSSVIEEFNINKEEAQKQQTQQSLEVYNNFASDVEDVIISSEKVLGVNIKSDEIKNKIRDLLVLDATGDSAFTKALQDPKKVTIMLTALLKEGEIHNNYNKGFEDGKKSILSKIKDSPASMTSAGILEEGGKIKVLTKEQTLKSKNDAFFGIKNS